MWAYWILPFVHRGPNTGKENMHSWKVTKSTALPPFLFLLGIWATWSTKGSRLINPMNATPESCSFLQSQQMEWDHTARDKRTSISLISKFQNIFRWLLLFFQSGSSISRLPYSDLLFIVMLQRVFVVVFHKKSKMGNVIEAEQGNLPAKHGQWSAGHRTDHFVWGTWDLRLPSTEES